MTGHGDTSRSTSRSDSLFRRSQEIIPGGVNSPVRAFAAVGGTPRFITEGRGARLRDVDGNEYIDYVMSWGPLIHGHAFAPVVRAIQEVAEHGTSFGAPTELELRLAEMVVTTVPSVEMVRFVNSGTEATMSALRLARGLTGRDLVIKFAGNYHGHVDALLAQAGSGSLTLGVPSSPGIPLSVAANTIVTQYNDVAALTGVFEERGRDIAAVIVEPIAGNMGVIQPQSAFLESIRDLTQMYGSMFICDEVITGFRVARGGAQELLDLTPDLTTLGKIIGGGLPVGAYGGKRATMEHMAPTGPIYQAGTLAGNPVAMAAGIASLVPLAEATFYERLESAAQQLACGLREVARGAGMPMTVNACTGMLTCFFIGGEVNSLLDASQADTNRYARFFHAMLDRGVYLPPSQFEAWMLSAAHTPEIIDNTLEAAAEALHSLSETSD